MRFIIKKKLLPLLSTILATAVAGIIIGFRAARPRLTEDFVVDNPIISEVTYSATNAPAASAETPELWLPRAAVVDMARVLAAHPATQDQYGSLQHKLAEIGAETNKETRILREWMAKFEWNEEQKWIVRDIQPIIAAYAVEHHFNLVLDVSSNLTDQSPVLLYSPDEVDFKKIITAPGVQNVTEQILQKLAEERPKGTIYPSH